MCRSERIIWLIEERVFGYLVSLGAHASRVCFTLGAQEYDILIENSDFLIITDYEDDNEES